MSDTRIEPKVRPEEVHPFFLLHEIFEKKYDLQSATIDNRLKAASEHLDNLSTIQKFLDHIHAKRKDGKGVDFTKDPASKEHIAKVHKISPSLDLQARAYSEKEIDSLLQRLDSEVSLIGTIHSKELMLLKQHFEDRALLSDSHKDQTKERIEEGKMYARNLRGGG